MSLTLQPVRVATGIDEEGMLVFDGEERLVAVLTRLGEQHDELSGQWFLEAGFGRLVGPDRPIFVDLNKARSWIAGRIARANLQAG